MRDWSEMPLDVLKEIAERIDYCEDFQSFGKVCNWWRRAMKMSRCKTSWQKLPWLMLAEPVDQLLNLYTGNIKAVNSNLGDHRRRYFSSCGWLISVTEIGLKVFLINPITGQMLQTPQLPNHLMCNLNEYFWEEDMYLTYFKKFALSETPSSKSLSSDFTLAVAFSVHPTVGFWRNGDDNWTLIDHDNETPPNRCRRRYNDIIFREGEFYGVTEQGMIVAFGKGKRPAPRVIADLDWYFPVVPGAVYLVDSGAGKLLLLRRDFYVEKNCSYYTMSFDLWEVDVEAGRIKDVVECCLGNRALFLGYNSSFSMDVSDVGFFKPNCVYYTDDLIECYMCLPDNKAGVSDMGVYDLAKNTIIEDFYNNPSCFSQVSPPLWIESPCQCHSYSYLEDAD